MAIRIWYLDTSESKGSFNVIEKSSSSELARDGSDLLWHLDLLFQNGILSDN